MRGHWNSRWKTLGEPKCSTTLRSGGKVSSESDSIVGFGEEGNATRHYTEVRFQFKYWSLLRKFIAKKFPTMINVENLLRNNS